MNVLQIIDRMKKALGVKGDGELADKLGIHFSSVSSWKCRKRVPAAQILKASQLSGESVEWISGHGSFGIDIIVPTPQHPPEPTPDEIEILTMYRALDPERKGRIRDRLSEAYLICQAKKNPPPENQREDGE